MAPLLGEDEISRQLDELEGWAGDTTALRRTVAVANFPLAIHIVQTVADVAEEINHHPDIDIRWRTLHFMLTTHSAGGVTRHDVELARRIEAIIREHVPSSPATLLSGK